MYQTKSRKRTHAADIHAAEQIARATQFAAHFRIGPAAKATALFASLAEARAAAAGFEAEHGAFGRRACVYAITDRGQFPIPESYQPSS